MLVKAPNGGIAKQDTSASVRLQAVFVGVNNNGIGLAHGGISSSGWLVQRFGNQPEVASVSPVDVNAEAVALAQRQNLVERIDCANCSGAEGDHDRSHIALAQFRFKRFQAHASAIVGGNGREVELQNTRDAMVRVMCLL